MLMQPGRGQTISHAEGIDALTAAAGAVLTGRPFALARGSVTSMTTSASASGG
ncbi:MAG: hypothetical protein AAF628_15925 [Planctomycetota bacterium]